MRHFDDNFERKMCSWFMWLYVMYMYVFQWLYRSRLQQHIIFSNECSKLYTNSTKNRHSLLHLAAAILCLKDTNTIFIAWFIVCLSTLILREMAGFIYIKTINRICEYNILVFPQKRVCHWLCYFMQTYYMFYRNEFGARERSNCLPSHKITAMHDSSCLCRH